MTPAILLVVTSVITFVVSLTHGDFLRSSNHESLTPFVVSLSNHERTFIQHQMSLPHGDFLRSSTPKRKPG